MQQKKRALGRGLEALLPQKPKQPENSNDKASQKGGPTPVDIGQPSRPTTLPISSIRPNEAQPRQYFDEEALHHLADSIKRRGLIQPVAVMPRDDGYVIVAGERRWRAAQLAEIDEIPVILLDPLSDQELLEYALVENLQREDLNPLEEARAYQSLQRSFSLVAEEIAERVGKSRSAIANSLRLLTLSLEMQEDLESERITAGHARAILSLERSRDQVKLRDSIVIENMSVRQAEMKAQIMVEGGAARSGKAKKPRSAAPAGSSSFVQDLQDQFVDALACKVRITAVDNDTRGKIEIHFESLDELEGILERLDIRE